jgi:anti-sigma B factor antagonist
LLFTEDVVGRETRHARSFEETRMDLDLDVTEQNGVAVLAVKGEVDVYTAPRLREKLVELVTQGKHRIVVNLEGVEFLDSTGLGVLVGAMKRLRVAHGRFGLVCAKEPLLKIFRITALDQVFPIYPTIVAATEDDDGAGSTS